MTDAERARVAVVDGLRTPFARRGGALSTLSAVDLGVACCAELIDRMSLDPERVDEVVYGQVILDVEAPNIAREVVLRTKLSAQTHAYSVSQACITGHRAVVCGVQAIRDGDARVVLAGGADSVSDAPLLASDRPTATLRRAERAEGPTERTKVLARLRPRDHVPSVPDLTEPTRSETMGEAAERMAKMNHISRQAQDELAHRSHALAARAWKQGRFAEEVMTLSPPPDYRRVVECDETVRFDSDLRRHRQLKPVFDRRYGTLTAGNSAPLADGASALVLMAQGAADELGYEPLGFVRSYAFAAVDPADQLLIGPVHAIPVALERAGVKLGDIDLVDLHEAFAAQVLSVLDKLDDAAYFRDRLGRSQPVGAVDRDRLNVNGGAIAFGHPLAATGGRQIIQTLYELRRRQGELAIVSACAAGGLAVALVLEAA